ncbi:MAG TPA: TetR/AcrR family transcriptional regulator [Planctomycetota bacterium]|nr:TetR/AcrR family transcriptional regulator [Planctomycetota bacterium]
MTSSENTGAARMREERRAQIISAAKAVFAERGYHKASVNDVIERAGIARGTFYLYFTGMANVFASLLEAAMRELRGRIRRIDVGPGAEAPEAQLRAMLRAVVEAALADRHFTTLLLSLWLSPDEEIAGSVASFYAHVTDLLAGALEHGLRMGLVRPCDPALVAPWLLGGVRGGLAHLLAADPPPALDDVVETWIGLAVRGVGIAGSWTPQKG